MCMGFSTIPQIFCIQEILRVCDQLNINEGITAYFAGVLGMQPQHAGPMYNPPQTQPLYTQQLPQSGPQLQPQVQVGGSGVSANYQHQQPSQVSAQWTPSPQQSTDEMLPSSSSPIQYSAGQRSWTSS